LKKIDSENCRKSFKRITKWSMNFIISTQQRKKPGTNSTKTKQTNSKPLNLTKNKTDSELKLEKCTTIRRTISNHRSSNNKKNITTSSPRNNSSNSSRKDDTRALTLNATLETKSSLLKDKELPSSSRTNRFQPNTTDESLRSKNEKPLLKI